MTNTESLLRVAFTSNATAQQTPLKHATGYATGAQHEAVKPPSLLAIARNKLSNKHATTSEKDAQQAPIIEDENKSLLRVAFTRDLTAQQAQQNDNETLTKDYAELTACIIDVCQLVGYSDAARDRMLEARRKLYPYQVATERDYFRLQVDRAKAGRYWI